MVDGISASPSQADAKKRKSIIKTTESKSPSSMTGKNIDQKLAGVNFEQISNEVIKQSDLNR